MDKKATSNEQKVTINDQKEQAKSYEQRAKNKEQWAESNEQQAKSFTFMFPCKIRKIGKIGLYCNTSQIYYYK